MKSARQGLPKNIVKRKDRDVYFARFNGKSKASPNLDTVKVWLANEKTKKFEEGRASVEFTSEQRVDAISALKILPLNWTLRESVQFVADHLKRTTLVLSVQEAIDRFLVTKNKASKYHSSDLSRRLRNWERSIENTRPIHGVTKQEIENYLARYSAQNFINHRAALSNLFRYACKIGATPENPLSGIERPRIKRARPAILSAEEFESLLGRARGQGRTDVLSWLVFGGLVGLRPYEVLRLEWTGIHFETCEIRIEPNWTKTNRARVIPLQENAVEWVKTIPSQRSGKVMPSESTWNNRWRRWRNERGVPLPLAWWGGKDDILRHSYGTYRAAILRNVHHLAEEMGNSAPMVRTHYDAVVSPSVARLWWGIRPEKPKNVVPMEAVPDLRKQLATRVG
jgi:integrase